ncbi:uncharacterized protein LOC100825041 [Brachypodium distachyon]|uniref:Uncharacterized protein n=1 Tax=Brachypodium distachyon TaxID=15368 RepID=I1GMW3_BRADI|nr:uncharacterized protein LOC100825041 [Brachypodium distachyon]KQK13009.1 hypothetical protein BRADI_1g07420v3 [Brachypodium distachyon]|eukprot:XP_003558887.1 uncharacterized protein LOC100825041 [Brachypodium distachyon]
MGLCVSCDAAADGAATARVVLPSGELREYSPPATAALALEEFGVGQQQKQGWFLCDADAMGFEGSVASVGGGEELRPGQIYFVLPAETLRRRLTGEEVAALAVKASAALVKAAASSATGGRRSRRGGSVSPLVFAPSEEDYSADTMSFAAKKAAVVQQKRRVVAYRGGRSPPRFSPDLTAIPESE